MLPIDAPESRFDEQVVDATGGLLRAVGLEVLQVNLGLRCSLRCAHCHLDASPSRTEQMSWAVAERVIQTARALDCRLVDLTGGAPELHPDLRRLVAALAAQGTPIQVRTNLSVLRRPELRDLPRLFREHGVRLVASLPCYLEENVRTQRGDGVFAACIAALRTLNEEGYGDDPALPLDLVHNPAGPSLPSSQETLAAAYREALWTRHGVRFSRLLTLANMPIGRFAERLRQEDAEASYRSLLRASFNPDTLGGVMCRRQLSVGWDGTLYDCDFNLALRLPVDHGAPTHIDQLDRAVHARRRIVTGEHCFGCTAGAGSSCGGALR